MFVKVPGVSYIQGRNAYSTTLKYAIAIHNTSNDASADNEASYARRRTDGISSHFYVDKNKVIQSLDTANRAGHAGSNNGNRNAIAVEVTGTNGKSRQWWLANVDWDELGKALASVMRTYGIPNKRLTVAQMRANPKAKGIYSHNDMRLAWGGTTHDDPGPNFPWDKLHNSISKYLNPVEAKPPTTTPTGVIDLATVPAQEWKDVHDVLVRGAVRDGERVHLGSGIEDVDNKVAALSNTVAALDDKVERLELLLNQILAVVQGKPTTPKPVA